MVLLNTHTLDNLPYTTKVVDDFVFPVDNRVQKPQGSCSGFESKNHRMDWKDF